MNFNHSEDIPTTTTTVGQSPGYDPKTSKRSSGLFSFFKWFKAAPSRESSIPDLLSSSSGSCDSINSRISTGTAASFSFVPPKSYKPGTGEEKSIAPGPETDTYKARLKERDKRREKDKNLTLRKKYNLFFNRETLLKPKVEEEEDNSKSLPLMTRKKVIENEDDGTSKTHIHRRTNSESSKLKKAGAYCHVKGKRKAPQPPINKSPRGSTLSLRRKKKVAPQPPPAVTSDKMRTALDSLETVEYADADIIFNDSLKLDHGVLKPVSDQTTSSSSSIIYSIDTTSSKKTSEKVSEIAPVSPRPWYKRTSNRDSASVVPKKEPFKMENKYEPIQFAKNDVKTQVKEEIKRKSGLTFLTNISELDREAMEIMKKENSNNENSIPPPFMRPKQEEPKNTDSWASPKRKSAKDLIAKFNAITNVTKVTVNSAFFGNSKENNNTKRDYFGRQLSVKEELLLQQNKNKKISDKYFGKVDSENGKTNNNIIPLMKSESAVIIQKNKTEKKDTPKSERKSWNCPKCSIQNEYWRIICHVCSTIKPYFDDLGAPSPKNNSLEKNKIENMESKHFPAVGDSTSTSNNYSKYKPPFKSGNETHPHFERSKTQIGFSALGKMNQNKSKEVKYLKSVSMEERTSNAASTAVVVVTENDKKEERERLKKMLIEMKNSLPKKKVNGDKPNFRSNSIIKENTTENDYEETTKKIVENNLDLMPPIQKSKLPTIIKLSSTNKASEEAKITYLASTDVKAKDENNVRNIIDNSYVTKSQTSAHNKRDNQDSKAENKTFHSQNKDDDNQEKKAETKPEVEKVATAYLLTTKTIYENVKVKRDCENSKPSTKVSSAVQTNGVIRKTSPETTNREDVVKKLEQTKKKNAKYELIRPKDFANIYSEKMENHIYANLIGNGGLFLNMPVNFEEIRNNAANNKDTLEIGRLLKKLESSIAKGELGEAANYARELAQHKVNCSVIRQKSEEENTNSDGTKNKHFTINMFVEDKTSHRGPFPIKVKGKLTVGELKMRVERDFEIPADVQKWIIGKQLASDDKATLNELNVYDEGSPLFLYLVAPQKAETKPTETTSAALKEEKLKKEISKSKVVEKVDEIKENNDVPVKSEEIIQKPLNAVVELKPLDIRPSAPLLELTEQAVDIKIEKAGKAPLVKEDMEDYDTKTLKPRNDNQWECIMCTLLNSKNSNICAACATIRRMTPSPTNATVSDGQPQKIARNRKYKAPQPQNLKNKEHYLQLVNLDNADLVENVETFECLICFFEVEPGQGVTLRECLHQFCKACLAHTIQFNEEAEVKCPYRDDQYSCEIALQDREIKALVSKEIYDQYLGRSVAQAENQIDKSFHCKTPDCKGWCIFEDNVNEFKCPVCRRVNCLTCQAIHMGLNCKQYQEKMQLESSTDENAKRTREMLNEMVTKGEALTCPTCQVILMKKWGCDWLRCSVCKTEICWVTRGPRWGPGGKGDTTGGCQCGVNGVKCHPQCNYCH